MKNDLILYVILLLPEHQSCFVPCQEKTGRCSGVFFFKLL